MSLLPAPAGICYAFCLSCEAASMHDSMGQSIQCRLINSATPSEGYWQLELDEVWQPL